MLLAVLLVVLPVAQQQVVLVAQVVVVQQPEVSLEPVRAAALAALAEQVPQAELVALRAELVEPRAEQGAPQAESEVAALQVSASELAQQLAVSVLVLAPVPQLVAEVRLAAVPVEQQVTLA